MLRQALKYKQRERFRQAERLIQKALRLKPANPVPFYSALGQVLYEREKIKDAERYLLRAYRRSPRQTGAGLVTLGSIYYEKGSKSRARKIYRQYIKYFPRGKHVQDVRAMLKN